MFGQPGLKQTPKAKSVVHMQRGVTVRALVRLAGDRGERISESVEIHLEEVKLVGAREGANHYLAYFELAASAPQCSKARRALRGYLSLRPWIRRRKE